MSRTLVRVLPLAACTLALALTAPPAAAQPEQKMHTHLIQISLLAASKTGASELVDLPENTRQAIEDVRRFLPFKSYRLLDTALVRAERAANTTLNGPSGREFRAAFNLNGPPVAGHLLVRSFELVEKVPLPAPLIAGGGGKTAPVSPASKQVLASSFSAEIGQTVVVGTSRLGGDDEALMVLFTALP